MTECSANMGATLTYTTKYIHISEAHFRKTYPNKVIVPFETNTDGVFTPSHGFRNIWHTQVALRDGDKNSEMAEYSNVKTLSGKF